MDEYQLLIQTLALTMGAAWASGFNLYATILMLGLGSQFGYVDLPESLDIVQDPMVLLAAGAMYFVEFFVDKTPGVDTGWDTLHTFIRIPAGAALAAGAVMDVSPALAVAAGIVGGGITSASHLTKAGTRAVANTSPEPFSNWGLSIGEDVAVFGGLALMIQHPLVFIVLVVLFIAFAIWVIPKLWRLIKTIFQKVRSWFPSKPTPQLPPQ